MKTIIEELREEKNKLIAEGQLPKWFTTGGWQTVKGKYLYKDERGMRDVWDRVSRAAAKHLPDELQEKAYNKFFNLFWNGWLAGATPVLTNMGTDRGCPVSCSGNYTADQIGGESGFYGSLQENAVLSKNGFGTSTYLGDIRERGANFGDKGKASGLLPVFKDGITMAKNVSQGSNRRGAIAQYVPICHPDFWELVKYVELNPDDVNIGWTFSKEFIAKLESGNQDAVERYQAMMKLRCLTGKGYIFKDEQSNADNPKSWLEAGLEVKASNLCTEIMLIANKDYSFTCVLSSMNASRYDEWKNTDSVFWATVFLDCVASEFVSYCKKDDDLKVDLRKAIAFTENSRALGLGCLGFHTYLQSKGIPFESLQAQFFNDELFKYIKEEAVKASKYLGELLGEPIWMKGTGLRNTHLLAVAPNTSSALICGAVSQGIEPVVANVWNQRSAAGEIARISPILLQLLKDKGEYSESVLKSIREAYGSVQHLDFLSDEEKMVFKTAYEIDQSVVVRLASLRQKYICQGQSLNLFFSADEDEAVISAVHKQAILDKRLKSLYYLRTMAGVQASNGECLSCHG